MDRILFLDSGAVVEGQHEELLDRLDRYRDMWESQSCL